MKAAAVFIGGLMSGIVRLKLASRTKGTDFVGGSAISRRIGSFINEMRTIAADVSRSQFSLKQDFSMCAVIFL